MDEFSNGYDIFEEVTHKAEPVAWIKKDRSSIEVSIMSAEYMKNEGFEPLYLAPPKREWVGITYDEVYEFVCTTDSYINLAKAIEAKLKEKNGVL